MRCTPFPQYLIKKAWKWTSLRNASSPRDKTAWGDCKENMWQQHAQLTNPPFYRCIIYIYTYTYTQHQTIYTYSHTVNIVHIIYGTCFANPKLHMIWLWLETNLLTSTSISPRRFHRHPSTKDQLSKTDATAPRCAKPLSLSGCRRSNTVLSNIGQQPRNHWWNPSKPPKSPRNIQKSYL